MLFSVVIPTRDRQATVTRAAQSVLRQTLPDLEVVVVDDGSIDGTREAVEALDDGRVRYVAETGRGANVARNAGAAVADGEFLLFLDDDDEVMATWLEELAGALRADPDAGVACCGVLHVFEDGRTTAKPPVDLGPAFDHVKGWFDTGSYTVRRDVFAAAGGFSEDLPAVQQTDLALRLVAACADGDAPIVVVDTPLVRVNQRPHDRRARNEPSRLLFATTTMLERHAARIGRDRGMLANYHAIAAVCAARLRRLGLARRHLLAAIRAQPLRPRHYARLAVACVPPVARRVWRWDP